jgi:centrosomal protein CEP164
MSPKSDQNFLYIVREALKTPLPPPWKPATSADGQLVYVNLNTKEITDEHPMD